MIKVNTRDYLSKTKFYFNKVKRGETIVIMHRNKPFAELMPFNENVGKPRWQMDIPQLHIKGLNVTKEFLKYRREERS